MPAKAMAAMRANQFAPRPFARASESMIEPFTAASARGRVDHRLQIVEQLAPVIALLLDLLDPVFGHDLQQGLPALELGGRRGLDRLASALGVVPAVFVGGLPRFADQRPAGLAARLPPRRLVFPAQICESLGIGNRDKNPN